MPTTRTYTVSFTPAERTEAGFRTTLAVGAAAPRHEVTATGFDELGRRIRELAQDFGQTCCVYVGLKDPRERKPPRFEAWCRTIQIIDYVPPVAA